MARHDDIRAVTTDAAGHSAIAVMELLSRERQRSVTIQFMPNDDGQTCRFEIIHVNGDDLGVVQVAADGSLRLEQLATDG